MLADAYEAQRRFDALDSHALCQSTCRRGTVCHGDIDPNHLIVSHDRIMLIDFETLRIDHSWLDLYLLLRRCREKPSWDVTSGRFLLTAYEAVFPLSRGAVGLVAVWLRFPHKACRVVVRVLASKNPEKLVRIVNEEDALRRG